MLKKLSTSTLKLFRNIFAGTPVQRWKITSKLYAWVFHAAYGKEDIEVSYKGIRLILPARDTAIVPSIAGGYFESIELDVFGMLSKKSKLIFDVGGNVGLYALVAAKKSKARIISFEPVPENIEYFRRNIKLNKVTNITIKSCAVGKDIGKVNIYLSEDHIGTHSAVQSHSQGQNYIEVPLTSLDKFMDNKRMKVDLLKVDVEGYDGMVYEGAEHLIESQHPTLFAEYAPVALKQCGYEPSRFINNIFDKYEAHYIFDEKKLKLRPVSKTELLAKDSSVVENILLVSNKDHIALIQKFII